MSLKYRAIIKAKELTEFLLSKEKCGQCDAELTSLGAKIRRYSIGALIAWVLIIDPAIQKLSDDTLFMMYFDSLLNYAEDTYSRGVNILVGGYVTHHGNVLEPLIEEEKRIINSRP